MGHEISCGLKHDSETRITIYEVAELITLPSVGGATVAETFQRKSTGQNSVDQTETMVHSSMVKMNVCYQRGQPEGPSPDSII